jgi:hypothetical protein
MVWSLSLQLPEEPELLDHFLLAAGKSLYLSNGFEAKCSYLLRLMKISKHYVETNDVDATLQLAGTLSNSMLGASLCGLRSFPAFDATDIARLNKAREARNFIAHKGADIGCLTVRGKHIVENIKKLREEVTNLTDGDNLVSRWIYEIEETEPAPHGICQDYPCWVDRWVFRSIDEFLLDYSPIEKNETGTERVLRMLKESPQHPDYVRP